MIQLQHNLPRPKGRA